MRAKFIEYQTSSTQFRLHKSAEWSGTAQYVYINLRADFSLDALHIYIYIHTIAVWLIRSPSITIDPRPVWNILIPNISFLTDETLQTVP